VRFPSLASTIDAQSGGRSTDVVGVDGKDGVDETDSPLSPAPNNPLLFRWTLSPCVLIFRCIVVDTGVGETPAYVDKVVVCVTLGAIS
jgi:hypothetical protein